MKTINIFDKGEKKSATVLQSTFSNILKTIALVFTGLIIYTADTNKAACCPLLIESRCLLMHLNTHFIFSTFHLSTTHFDHFLNVVYKKRKSRPNECSPERTEALTPNGCVSSAKLLMDDANYQRLTGPHKRNRSICHVVYCTHLKMSDNDSRLKHGNHQEHIVQVWWGKVVCSFIPALSQSEFLMP